LDTSVIALLRKDKDATAKLEEAAARGGMVATTVVNLCELYAGAYGSRRVAQELQRVEGLASLLQVLDFNEAVAKKYGELVNSQALRQKPIGDFDLIIASIPLSSG
jgi:predicted nucleic acid-binding protein